MKRFPIALGVSDADAEVGRAICSTCHGACLRPGRLSGRRGRMAVSALWPMGRVPTLGGLSHIGRRMVAAAEEGCLAPIAGQWRTFDTRSGTHRGQDAGPEETAERGVTVRQSAIQPSGMEFLSLNFGQQPRLTGCEALY